MYEMAYCGIVENYAGDDILVSRREVKNVERAETDHLLWPRVIKINIAPDPKRKPFSHEGLRRCFWKCVFGNICVRNPVPRATSAPCLTL